MAKAKNVKASAALFDVVQDKIKPDLKEMELGPVQPRKKKEPEVKVKPVKEKPAVVLIPGSSWEEQRKILFPTNPPLTMKQLMARKNQKQQ